MESKRPAIRYVLRWLISGRYLWERSVTITWRSIAYGSTDRMKALQPATLKTVRAMRAVVCRTLRQKFVVLAVSGSVDFDHGPPKPPRASLKQRRGSSRTGAHRLLRPSKRHVRTPVSARPYLS